jgi:hypothetical protein
MRYPVFSTERSNLTCHFHPKSNLNLPSRQSLTVFTRLSPKILPLNFNQEARGIPVDTWFAARKVLEALSEVV